jgi:hypothetical protein
MLCPNICTYHSAQSVLSSSLLYDNAKIKIYKTIIFACCFVWVWNIVAHNEGGTRLRVSENRVLRWVFGLKTDEVTDKWRRLHNEKLYD